MNISPVMLNGSPVTTSKWLTAGVKKVQRRRHKAKRVNKKWLNRYGYIYIPIPDPRIYFINGAFVGHPITIAKILREIKKGENVSCSMGGINCGHK